jgi:hypothetical protein
VVLAFDDASMGIASPTKKAFSATITIPSAATPGAALHTVTASCDGHKGAARATFTVLRPTADLETIAHDSVLLNGEIQLNECGVAVHNLGPDAASNVVVGINSNPGLVISADETSAGSYDPTTRRWTIGSLVPNSSATLRCSVTVVDTTFAQNIDTVVVANSDAADPNPDNNVVVFRTFYTP